MFNEIIFIFHSLFIAASSLIALSLGQGALIAFVCVQCILANLFVIKQITLFGLIATSADAYTVGATLGLNLLQEYFGKTITKKTIWINFSLLVFYCIATQIHVWYAPNSFDTSHIHFMPLLLVMPRIVIASFSVYLFVQLLDYYIYGFLKKIYADRYIVLRNYASIAFCQLIDTILFSFLGLYGIVENVWHIIIVSYCIKIVSIFIATPFVSFSRTVYKWSQKDSV